MKISEKGKWISIILSMSMLLTQVQVFSESEQKESAEKAYIILDENPECVNMTFNDALVSGITDKDDPDYNEVFTENGITGRRVFKANYLKFKLSPDYYQKGDSFYKITIQYYDFGPSQGTFGVEYRTRNGNFNTAKIVKEGGVYSKTWCTKSITVSDADFGDGDYDIRITTNVYNAYARIEVLDINRAAREGKDTEIGITSKSEALGLNKLGLMELDTKNADSYLSQSVTRGELIKMLVKAAGRENEIYKSKYECEFSDVPDELVPYVVWAEEKNITKGVGNGLFGTNNPATVGQAIAFFMRILGYDETNYWSDPIDYAMENNFTDTSKLMLSGDMELTRDHFAAIAYNAIVKDNLLTGKSLLKEMMQKGIVTDEMLDNSGDLIFTAYKYAIPRKFPSIKLRDGESGREYHVLDCLGRDIIRAYFTAQQFNNDATKFVFGVKPGMMFEYDTETEMLTFRDFADVASNRLEAYVNMQDKIFYERTNSKGRVTYWVMDWNTKKKRNYANLPDGVVWGENIIASNDGKTVSVQWGQSSDPRDFSNGKMRARVLATVDVETGEFYAERSHEFDGPPGQDELGHPMLNPANKDLVMFCHEAKNTEQHARIWMCDMTTGETWNVFRQAVNEDGTTAEPSTHEVWQSDGKAIVFIKSRSAQTLGEYGICRVKPDGSDREYFTNSCGFSLWHCSTTYDGTFVAGDTNMNPAHIVLTDTRTYEQQCLVSYDAGSKWPNDPYQPHITLSNNGKMACWEMYYKPSNIYTFAWMDISDITEREVTGGRIEYNENLDYVTYSDCEIEVNKTEVDGVECFSIPYGHKMYFDVKDSLGKTPSGKIKVTFKYLDRSRLPIMLRYTSSVEDVHNLYKQEDKYITIERNNSGVWKEAEILIDELSLENSCKHLCDFVLSGQYSEAKVTDIKVEIK